MKERLNGGKKGMKITKRKRKSKEGKRKKSNFSLKGLEGRRLMISISREFNTRQLFSENNIGLNNSSNDHSRRTGTLIIADEDPNHENHRNHENRIDVNHQNNHQQVLYVFPNEETNQDHHDNHHHQNDFNEEVNETEEVSVSNEMKNYDFKNDAIEFFDD